MSRFLPSLTGSPRTLVFGATLTLLAIGATFLLDPYRNFQLATIAAYFCAIAGLTVLVGLSGQLSLGQAALMAAGGYGYALTANAVTDAGIDGAPRFLLGLLGAVVVSGLLGLLLGLAAARLRGPYLAGVTLALVIAVPAVTAVFSGILGGDQGLRIPYDGVPAALQALIAVEQWQAWVAILVTGVVVTALAAVRRSGFGLRMRAVRDDETAARLNGVHPGRVKVSAFTLSSIAAGAGGAIVCFVTQSVSPGAYTLAFSLLLVVAVVVGGLGSIGGAAIGAALIVMLPWTIGTATSSLTLPSDLQQRLTGNLSVLVFGVLLIVVMLVWPGGIAGIRRSRRRPARAGAGRPAAAAAGPASAGGGSAGGSSGTATDAEHSARAGSAAAYAARAGFAAATPAPGDLGAARELGLQHPLDSAVAAARDAASVDVRDPVTHAPGGSGAASADVREPGTAAPEDSPAAREPGPQHPLDSVAAAPRDAASVDVRDPVTHAPGGSGAASADVREPGTAAPEDSPAAREPGPQHPLDSVPFTTERKR